MTGHVPEGRLTRGALEILLWLSAVQGAAWALVWLGAVTTVPGGDVPDYLPSLAAWCAGSLLLVAPACLVAWLGGERLHRYAGMLLATVVLATSTGWPVVEGAYVFRVAYLAVGVGLLVVALPSLWRERARLGTRWWPVAARLAVAAAMLALLLLGARITAAAAGEGLVDRAAENRDAFSFLLLGLWLCAAALGVLARVARGPRLPGAGPGDDVPALERLP